MNIKSTLALYAGQSTGSSLVPSDLDQQEKDIVRRRLVKTSPDIDSEISDDKQTREDSSEKD